MNFDPAEAHDGNQAQLDGVAFLAELALNLHWTWNHATDELWKRLNAELWQHTRNPWVVLQTVSRDTVNAALAEPEFRQLLETILQRNRDSYAAKAWFQRDPRFGPLTTIAYFSMEFMLGEALP